MNIENKQPQVNEFLKRAKEAEALADSVDDPAARQVWIKIAIHYRDLAAISAINRINGIYRAFSLSCLTAPN